MCHEAARMECDLRHGATDNYSNPIIYLTIDSIETKTKFNIRCKLPPKIQGYVNHDTI